MDRLRLIKFRGKDLEGKWHYGDLVHLGDGCIIIEESKLGEPIDPDKCEFALGYHKDEFAVVDPDTVGRFTGSVDRNGTEIYEGDILELAPGKYYDLFFARDELAFMMIASWVPGIDTVVLDFKFELLTVVGNRHDNPTFYLDK